MTSFSNGPANIFTAEEWPGGQVTLGTPTCHVTLQVPSGRIDETGSTASGWSIVGKVGFGTAVLTVNMANCATPGAISEGILNNRPACTSALSYVLIGITLTGPYHSTASVSIAAT
jgi:hypothetical protein